MELFYLISNNECLDTKKYDFPVGFKKVYNNKLLCERIYRQSGIGNPFLPLPKTKKKKGSHGLQNALAFIIIETADTEKHSNGKKQT